MVFYQHILQETGSLAGTIFEGEEGFLKTMVFDNTDYKMEDFSLENTLKEVGKVRVKDIYFKNIRFADICIHQ